MKKLVYLHELDSVRANRWEILRGQQAMHREIVERGNCVVITYNQLTDAQAFLVALRFPESYDRMLKLFSNGSIKVSRYIAREDPQKPEIRTAAQYVLNAVNKALATAQNGIDQFIFSGLPIPKNNVMVLRALRDALQYSDLARLQELIEVAGDPEKAAEQEALGIQGMKKDKLEYIYRYAELILELSRMTLSHVEARPGDDAQVRLFADYLKMVLEWDPVNRLPVDPVLAEQLPGALALLRAIAAENHWLEPGPQRENRRSPWLSSLEKRDRSRHPEIPVAQAVINLCYNYTVEESILDVQKSFADNIAAHFCPDFFNRLAVYWKEYLAGHHNPPSTKDAMFHIQEQQLPDWSLAVRIRDDAAKLKHIKSRPGETERSLWLRLRSRAVWKKILITMLYVPMFLVMDWGMELLKTLATEPGALELPGLAELGPMFLWALVTTLGFGLLSDLLGRVIEIPDISDTMQHICEGLGDLWILAHPKKGVSNHD